MYFELKQVRTNPKRLKEGIATMNRMIVEDARRAMSRGPRLPSDWQGRIIR